jgi:dipeptidyl aminopeptidase/acylaminoacyl peptidase
MNGRAGARIGRILSIASLAIAFVLAVTASAGAAPGPRWIVFSATPSGQHTDQLFRIQASGEGLQQITTGGYPSIDPAFSPDGKRIAFARTGVGILTMNVDGTGIRRLTKNGRDGFPAWSPDSRQIAFIRPYKAEWTIHTMSSSGAGQRPLSKAPPSGRPSWTAAGLLIPSGGDLLKIDPATGHVLKYYGAEIDAVWGLNSVALSPDRSKIAFVGARTAEVGDKECGEGPCQRFALYKETLVGKTKKPQRIVKDAGPATFSPNGKQLAFVANGGLVLWTLAGSKPTAVSTGDAYPTVAAPPAWQP